jgi:hypothetical protein
VIGKRGNILGWDGEVNKANITLAKRNRKRHTVLPLPRGILATAYPGIRAQASQHKKKSEKKSFQKHGDSPSPLVINSHHFSTKYEHPR